MQQGAEEFLWFDRLGDVAVHARRQAALAILGEGVGGHRQDGRSGASGQCADQSRGLQAVHHRHLNVHQDEVVGRRAGLGNGRLTVVGKLDLQADAGQQLHRDLLIDRVVLRQQDQAPVALAQPCLCLTSRQVGSHGTVTSERILQGVEEDRGCQRLLQNVRIAAHGQVVRFQAFGVRGDQQACLAP